VRNIVEPGSLQITTWSPNTLSKYVTVKAVPLQQWQHKRFSLSRTYIACLLSIKIVRLAVVWVSYAAHNWKDIDVAAKFERKSPKDPRGLWRSRVSGGWSLGAQILKVGMLEKCKLKLENRIGCWNISAQILWPTWTSFFFEEIFFHFFCMCCYALQGVQALTFV
jgi:hypothetical protein